MLFALGSPVETQQPGKMPRIGYPSRGSGPGANEEIFRQGLRSLGYIEGVRCFRSEIIADVHCAVVLRIAGARFSRIQLGRIIC